MKCKIMQVGILDTNCYLLQEETSGRWLVVDPGGDGDRIIRELESENAEVQYILLTHGHADHVGGLTALTERYPEAQVYIHAADAEMDVPNLFPLPAVLKSAHHYDEGDELPFGDSKIRVLHTPGHTEGSVVLLLDELMLCGDTLFAGSYGRTDFPGGDEKKMFASLGRLYHLEGNYQVCPGHMETSTLMQEKLFSNPYLRMAGEQMQRES